MAAVGLDYAGGRPGGAAIKAAGYGFVVRYLSDGGPNLPGKLLTPAEYADLQAHGIAVVANWETTADRMRGGFQAGVTDANRADSQIRSVGHPTDLPCYFSADWDVSPAEQAEVDDYLRGCASVISLDRVGVYGSYYVCKRCLDNHTATWAWQTGAWSGGQREPRAHIYQRIGSVAVGGVQCDVNEALQPEFGQHPTGAELTPDEHRLLQECHDELYRRIKTRAGEGPNLDYEDTILGYAANSDGFGYRNEQHLMRLEAAFNTLAVAVATQHSLNLDDLKALLDTELAKVVNVRISVDAPPDTL